MNLARKQSITLTELIIAIVLLGTVFLVATTFNLASYNFYYSTDKFVQTQLAISPAMEQIVKEALRATGDVTSTTSASGFFPAAGGSEIHIRRDYNAAGAPNNTPSDYLDDIWAGFRLNGNNLEYCSDCVRPNALGACNSSWESMASNRITAFNVTPNFTDPNCRVDIQITGRYNPSQPSDPDNPEVTLMTSLCPRSLSLR